jgi:NTP pyrophosphatase (non-canonical NTP hydrolase)
MASFSKNQSISHLQKFNQEVYGIPDDRMYSVWDLLGQMERFGMRALKGIRKGEKEKVALNLLISLSWVMAIANRLHIHVEDEVWRRFPMYCSYCGQKPCRCQKFKITRRQKLQATRAQKPETLAAFQNMFAQIYPPDSRSLAEGGMHLAEEIGEVTEAVHNFLGQYKPEQFEQIKLEIADFISCLFGVANSAGIKVADELAKLFTKNCHVCHKAPCTCDFAFVARIKT